MPGCASGERPPAAESVHESRTDHADLTRVKLMIVDDEPIVVKSIQNYLRSLGYQHFVTTTDSTQALALLEAEQPDLLLLDIMMPEISGLELLRQIRSHTVWRNLPLIILTACHEPRVRREALECGATDFLAKPVDPHELALRLRNVLVAKVLRDQMVMRAERLEAEIERQREELATARDDAELRYVAGKAEIATDVLHNVGNALQSVNTGVNLVAYTVRESKLPLLKRVAGLLHEHVDNLPRFLTKDPRGKILPSYLIELSEALLAERQKINTEVELLTKHLEHINAVVATQQKYAALCNVTEEVQLTDVIADLEELVGGSFARHDVEVVREFQDVPPVNTDRQKLLQVLLNLVKNALEAIKHNPSQQAGQLTLRIGRVDSHKCFIEVADNGEGIAPHDLIKIFAHGFTTKAEGHGFGLHSCANIMKELGGSIRVHSAGKGHGAQFVLELPLHEKDSNA